MEISFIKWKTFSIKSKRLYFHSDNGNILTNFNIHTYHIALLLQKCILKLCEWIRWEFVMHIDFWRQGEKFSVVTSESSFILNCMWLTVSSLLTSLKWQYCRYIKSIYLTFLIRYVRHFWFRFLIELTHDRMN